MNTNLVSIVKGIAADYGEAVLADPQRLKAFFSDLAKEEPKPLCIAFGRCIEAGAYTALKTASDRSERGERKTAIAQRVRGEHGLDVALCGEALDILEAALYGTAQTTPPRPEPKSAPRGMAFIQGGTFTMGSSPLEPRSFDNEVPQHSVTVSSFYMSRYEVTQQEYQAVMGSNPSYFKGDNLPVEQVSWYDAVEYCNQRSQREGLTPAYTRSGDKVTWNRSANGYRLPTEAEWEYACRAGTTTTFSTGNTITTSQANYGWQNPYNGNSKGIDRRKTTPVGSFAPNPWGLYDMHGNLWEWCWDWYRSYSGDDQTNPVGPVAGSDRVRRGGSWYNDGGYLRSANRYGSNPSSRGNNLGFRLVRP